MARLIKKKKAWDKVRFRMGPNYVEVREYKPAETVIVALLVLAPVVCLMWASAIFSSPTRSQMDVGYVLGAIGVVVALAALILYRPPRIIRLFTMEQLAQTSRQLMTRQVLKRWHDLGQTPLVIENTRVISDESSTSGGAAAVGCLLVLLGPLGLLLSLFAGSSKDKDRYLAAYALIRSGANAKPLGVFLKRADAQKLMDLYHATDPRPQTDFASTDQST